MAQGYYTLDEAAKILHISADEMKQMARKGQLRSFQDRGTWRFRVQDIDEMARTRSAGSDPELPLADLPKPRTSDSPSPRSPAPKTREGAVFHFADDEVGVGGDPVAKTGSTSGSGRRGPKSPTVPPASDSEVRLVMDGSDLNFEIAPDKSPRPGSKLRTGTTPRPPGSSKLSKVDSQKSPRPESRGPAPEDSDIRLVPMDSDSDVHLADNLADSDVAIGGPSLKSPTDSDIRLELAGSPPPSDEGMLTDEINLDEELLKADAKKKPLPQSKLRPKTKRAPEFPTTSPFELAEEPADADAGPGDALDSSSDFELTPMGESSSPLDSASDDEFRLELPDDEDIGVGKAGGALKGPSSGISLDNPLDSGISLEEESSSDSDDFDLLTLDSDDDKKSKTSSDSEFELTLDDEAEIKPTDDSDSEFELTLDDSSGDLEPLAKDDGIFDTDFDVPELDESGSQAVAVDDTDSSGSDFDLALGDDDISIDEESGSQVVAIDEEDVDDSAATIAARRRKKPIADIETDEDFGELSVDEELAGVEEELAEDQEPAVTVKAQPPAPWGVLPVICLVPSVAVLFLAGVIGLEMLQGMSSGYKSPGVITRTLGKLIDANAFKN
jgi:excisionase family DNA binding protein